MKNVIIMIFLFISFNSFSQKKTKNIVRNNHNKTNWTKENIAHRCKEVKLFSVRMRNNMYPFKKATKIELVAFEDIDNYRDNYISDTTFFDNGDINNSYPPLQLFKFASKFRDKKHINKTDDFSLPPFKKRVVVSSDSRDSLSNILFNFKFLGKTRTDYDVKCYQPRNAILFYDAEGNLLEYLEICFSCTGRRLSWNNNNIDWCDSKYEKLGLLFRQSGIKFGTYEMMDKRNYE
ncbi:MAG: hypothetical protein U5N85_22045 [Arcicella sp.]|nr:hypothetical protein [Arcicella sp.]